MVFPSIYRLFRRRAAKWPRPVNVTLSLCVCTSPPAMERMVSCASYTRHVQDICSPDSQAKKWRDAVPTQSGNLCVYPQPGIDYKTIIAGAKKAGFRQNRATSTWQGRPATNDSPKYTDRHASASKTDENKIEVEVGLARRCGPTRYNKISDHVEGHAIHMDSLL